MHLCVKIKGDLTNADRGESEKGERERAKGNEPQKTKEPTPVVWPVSE